LYRKTKTRIKPAELSCETDERAARVSVNVKQLSQSSVRRTLSSSALPSQEAVSASTDEERLAMIHNVIQQLPPPHYRSVSGSPAHPGGRRWNTYS